MLKRILTLAVGATVLWGAMAMSADDKKGLETIKAAFPGLTEQDIHPTPVDGWFEIMLGSQVAYVSSDAKYVLRGDLIEIATNVNYTENRRNEARRNGLAKMPDKDAITFGSDQEKHAITVFTDIDCGYCRKLHQEIDQLADRGITVTYLFFPRAGPGSASWSKAESVWCADDRNTALTSAKAGEPVAPKQCGDTPIAAQYDMGRQVGLRGTPAIVTDTGQLISGYLPADRLLAELERGKAAVAGR